MSKIDDVLKQTDWALLAQQKLALLAIEDNPAVDGIINFLDALQDAAAAEGYPVQWI